MRVARDLVERGIFLQPQGVACLVQHAVVEVAAALDVDCREILALGRVGEEIPEVVDDVSVEGRRRGFGLAAMATGFRLEYFSTLNEAYRTAP